MSKGSDYEAIKRHIQKMAAGVERPLIISAQVKEVSGDTCSVKLDDGLELTDVRLNAGEGGEGKYTIKPKAGSRVTLICPSTAKDRLTVIAVNEVEEIVWKNGQNKWKMNGDGVVFNGGSNGGLVNWPEAKTELDKVKAFMNAITTLANGTVITEPGGASAWQAALKGALSAVQIPSFDSKEDGKVKH